MFGLYSLLCSLTGIPVIALRFTEVATSAYGVPMTSQYSLNQDPAKRLKTSQKVAATIVKYGTTDDPVHIDADTIGADELNRNGSIPNIQVVSRWWEVANMFNERLSHVS